MTGHEPSRSSGASARAAPPRPRILFVCTEDWFFLSHFAPLVAAAATASNAPPSSGSAPPSSGSAPSPSGTAPHSASTTPAAIAPAIATSIGAGRAALERLGLQVLAVDFHRHDFGVLRTAQLLIRLALLLRRERPDIVHFIALKPIAIGGLAALALPRAACVYHLTGLGVLGAGHTRRMRLLRGALLRLLAWLLHRRRSWLLVENQDDLALLQRLGAPVDIGRRATRLGGAGVDPERFGPQPMPDNPRPRAGFVGRMVWSKGVDVLIEAQRLLGARGIALDLDLHGAPDPANPRAIPESCLALWNKREGVRWHGRTSDVRAVWRRADMAVFPSRGGEGLPRALLEAAACGRPLIVSDVPGCRDFVRHGIEGLVVPPEDPEALAEALVQLAADKALRERMGRAARARVLEGHTEAHVRKAVAAVYGALRPEP